MLASNSRDELLQPVSLCRPWRRCAEQLKPAGLYPVDIACQCELCRIVRDGPLTLLDTYNPDGPKSIRLVSITSKLLALYVIGEYRCVRIYRSGGEFSAVLLHQLGPLRAIATVAYVSSSQEP